MINMYLLRERGRLLHRFFTFFFTLFIAADAINNAAGFGFRGYDENGTARWDLISNLRIQQIEVSKSLTSQLPYDTLRTPLCFYRSWRDVPRVMLKAF